ncbi:MAG: hypothetical protein JJU00_03120 [Opitutales bacterium]|nr:hypothetical protein [Opitutales bacterium]
MPTVVSSTAGSDTTLWTTDGEYLTEFASGEAEVRSRVFKGLVLRREWLDPKALPDVEACLREAEGKA